jgi:HSP20 family molecular chaperone IbpA
MWEVRRVTGEEKRETHKNKIFEPYENHSKYLMQDPLIEVREYSDHVRILAEVSDQDPSSVIVRPVDTSRIEILFRYRGRNVKKLITLTTDVSLDNYEIKVKNGVAKINLRKNPK